MYNFIFKPNTEYKFSRQSEILSSDEPKINRFIPIDSY